MRRNISTPASVTSTPELFDTWFDPVEDGIRARVRGFIETMLEEELDGALSRWRYARWQPNEGEEAVVRYRHGHRTRTLTGTFGKTEISVPRARVGGADGKTRA